MAKNDYLPELLQNISQTVERIEERQNEHGKKLNDIEKQVIKTNGRVTALEKYTDKLSERIKGIKQRLHKRWNVQIDNKVLYLLAVAVVIALVVVAKSQGIDVKAIL